MANDAEDDDDGENANEGNGRMTLASTTTKPMHAVVTTGRQREEATTATIFTLSVFVSFLCDQTNTR